MILKAGCIISWRTEVVATPKKSGMASQRSHPALLNNIVGNEVFYGSTHDVKVIE
jgi:hypothetical protein